MLFDHHDDEDVWNRVEEMFAKHLKNNNINFDAKDLTDKLEWPVKVRLKKWPSKLHRLFFLRKVGGDRSWKKKRKDNLLLRSVKRNERSLKKITIKLTYLPMLAIKKKKHCNKLVKMQLLDGRINLFFFICFC